MEMLDGDTVGCRKWYVALLPGNNTDGVGTGDVGSGDGRNNGIQLGTLLGDASVGGNVGNTIVEDNLGTAVEPWDGTLLGKNVGADDKVDIGEILGLADRIDEGEFKHCVAPMKIVCVYVNSAFASADTITLSHIRSLPLYAQNNSMRNGKSANAFFWNPIFWPMGR